MSVGIPLSCNRSHPRIN